MKKSEIVVGGKYLAKVGDSITTVRVDAIRERAYMSGGQAQHVYDVTNLRTGRKTTFRSAAKFRSAVVDRQPAVTTATVKFEPLTHAEAMACGDHIPPPTTEDLVDAGLPTAPEGEQRPDPIARSVVGTTPVVATSPNLASRIAFVRAGRAVGTPVAGMVPNAEQESILALANECPSVVVVMAGAGSGKTATCQMLEQTLPGRVQYTAFNRPLVDDGRKKFKRARCSTTHGLAFGTVGKQYQHKLGRDRVRSYEIARILGITDMTVTLVGMGPTIDGKPTDKVKTLAASFLAGQVITAVNRFAQSADREIGGKHFRPIAGIDVVREDGTTDYSNSNRVNTYLVESAKKAWVDMVDMQGTLPFAHDYYVKIWQLGTGDDRPIIPADHILLDEYQDTAPVFLDVLMQQKHAQIIMVGDDNQRIYEWRGAVNAGDSFPNAPRRMLSQSYRFGQAVADVANAVLRTLEEPTKLVMRGNPAIASKVEQVAQPKCYLYRTNAGAIGQVMACIGEKRKPHLFGGKSYIADMAKLMEAVLDLQAKRRTQHPELGCFETWKEVEEYSKSDEGADLRILVKLVTTFSAKAIHTALVDMVDEADADAIIATAHKSKGREWDTVKLGGDFPLANRMTDADRRLLYVAATRAKLILDITECPPFCGGWDGLGEDKRWIPGIEVVYTSTAPATADAVEEKVEKIKEIPCLPEGNRCNDSNGGQTTPQPPPENTKKGNDMATTCTYTKLRDDSWGIRATSEIKAGQVVTVTTKAGVSKTETVGKVLWSGNGVWLATKVVGATVATTSTTKRNGSTMTGRCWECGAAMPKWKADRGDECGYC